MNRLKIVTVCGSALLIVASVAVVVAWRNRRQAEPSPEMPVAASPAEVRVKVVERKGETVEQGEVAVGKKGRPRGRAYRYRYAKRSSAELIAEGATS